MKKILLFLFITIIVIAVISYVLTLTHNIPIGEKVGLIRVEGVILASKDVIDELKTYAKDSSIKAVVIRIDSPCGAVAPAQEIYKEIVKLKKEKKCVESLGSGSTSV